ncbi:GSCFA domain-containing protein [Xanthobacter agilis]|uniref:GSCFA domain-containing protein n=1 Tax=Xanthobacter agilis TaxID=47492 RepID=UPI00372BB816
MTPYRKQKRIHFWRTATQRSVDQIIHGLYTPKFPINSTARIATAGSCFAQNVRAHLIEHKLQFLDVELPPPFLPEDRIKSYGYGLFSARFGNIYTTEQLHQLALRAFGEFETNEPFWERGGRYFDPLRSTIEPTGFVSIDESQSARSSHLHRVCRLFDQADILIFTLGLTETWLSRSDGTVFPLCPGVSSGEFDEAKYMFKNSSVADVVCGFERFRLLVKKRNPGLRFVLTVSPVALEATASQDNVIVATTLSKSVLRSAAGQLHAAYDDVDYFPSYEIFTSPVFKSKYFKENMRDPTSEGVSLAMDLFFKSHGLSGDQPAEEVPAPDAALDVAREQAQQFEIQQQLICDEMLLAGENSNG